MKSLKEWYTAKELEGLAGLPIHATNITRKAKAENWLFREAKGIKGGGFEYHYSALPEAVQKILGFDNELTAYEKEVAMMEKASFSEELDKRLANINQLEGKLTALLDKVNTFEEKNHDLNNDETKLLHYFKSCNQDGKLMLLLSAKMLAAMATKE